MFSIVEVYQFLGSFSICTSIQIYRINLYLHMRRFKCKSILRSKATFEIKYLFHMPIASSQDFCMTCQSERNFHGSIMGLNCFIWFQRKMMVPGIVLRHFLHLLRFGSRIQWISKSGLGNYMQRNGSETVLPHRVCPLSL